MRKTRLAALLLALALLCSSCGKKAGEPEGTYQLYFTVSGRCGAALSTQAYTGAEEPDPGALLSSLLLGPTQEGLTTPFPRGTVLQSWAWDESREGNLRVWLSEEYSRLADISLTLADYCIVLTLSQLDGVESVEILSDGHTVSYRSHQVLSAEEALLQTEA